MPPWALPALAAALWGGILAEGTSSDGLGRAGAAALLSLGVCGVAASVALHGRSRRADRRGASGGAVAWMLLAAAFLSLGGGWAALREARVLASPLAGLAGRLVTVQGSVQDPPRAGRFGWTATLGVGVVAVRESRGPSAVRVGDPVWVEGRGRPPDLEAGDRIEVQGVMSPLRGPFGTWLRHRGYPAVLEADRVRRLGPASDPLRRSAIALRGALARSVQRVFSERDAGLLMGLALGDTSRLDPTIEDEFRATGLSHLTAVSGENLAMFLAPIMGLVGLLRVGRWARLFVGVAAIAFFVLLTGAEPSVARAAAMAGLTVLGMFLGRPRSAPSILGAAVLFLLAMNPTLVYLIGFQLSVAATAGMALLAQPLAARLGLLPPSVALAAGATVSAQIGVAPLLLYHFGVVPLVGVPANLLAFPAVSPAMLLGLLAAGLATVVPILGGGVAVLARVPLGYLERLAHVLARSPLPSVTSPGGRVGQLAVGVALVLLLGWWIRSGAGIPRRALAIGAIAIPLFLWTGALRAGPPASLTAVFFNVAQGDGAMVRSPGGATIVIDGGGDLDLMARKLASLGVRRIDLLVATHPHDDHVGGLPAVLVRFRVGMVAEPGCRGESPMYAEFLRSLGAADIPARHPRTGDVISVGDVRIEVLGPSHCYRATDSDPNNDSLVLRVLWGGASILFTGDAEEPAQTEMLSQEAAWMPATVLKVPHHGGATSLPSFLQAVHPVVAVISVGPNRYGHPAPELVAELIRDGMRVFRTDRSGDVTVTFRGDEVLVDEGG